MQVQLVRAMPHRCELVDVEVAEGACVGDALATAGWQLDASFIALAVFGQAASLQTALHPGDRVELLRPLLLDPKQARRKRAGKTARGSA